MARWFAHRLPQQGIPSVSLGGCFPRPSSWAAPTGRSPAAPTIIAGSTRARCSSRSATRGTTATPSSREALDRGAAGVVRGAPLPRGRPAPGGRRRRPRGPCADLPGPRRRPVRAARDRRGDRDLRQDRHKPVRPVDPRGRRPAVRPDRRPGLVGRLANRPWRGIGPGRGPRFSPGRRPARRAWPGGAAGLASILAYMVDQDCAAGVIEAAGEALEARCFEGVSVPGGRGHRRGRALRPAHRDRAAGPAGQGEALPQGGPRGRGGGQRRRPARRDPRAA